MHPTIRIRSNKRRTPININTHQGSVMTKTKYNNSGVAEMKYYIKETKDPNVFEIWIDNGCYVGETGEVIETHDMTVTCNNSAAVHRLRQMVGWLNHTFYIDLQEGKTRERQRLHYEAAE
jgi:hypothetical protein